MITYKMSTSTIVQGILIGLVFLVGIVRILLDHLFQHHYQLSDDSLSVYFYFNNAIIMRIVFIIIFFISFILSMVLGIVFSIIIAFLMSKIRPLSWYGNSTLAIFLYGLPCLIGIVSTEALWGVCCRWILKKWSKKNSIDMKSIDMDPINRRTFDFERHFALLIVYCILMIISIGLGYRSLYFILIWSIFVCPIYLLLILSEIGLNRFNYQVPQFFGERHWYWTFAPYIVSILPLIHSIELVTRLIRMTIPMMGRMFQTMPVPRDVVISVLVAVLTALFFLIFIPNMQRTLYFGRTLILLIISFIIVFIVACTRQQFSSVHPKIVTVKHESQFVYGIETPTNLPVFASLVSQSALITVASVDDISLLPILDEFSTKTRQPLVNRQCKTSTYCTFDDTFNRTMAIKEIELVSIINITNYKLIFRHISSYQIGISTMNVLNVNVENSAMRPRSETIVIVEPVLWKSNFSIEMKIERCDIEDSPFLTSLVRTIPYMVMWGRGRCQMITDTITLAVTAL